MCNYNNMLKCLPCVRVFGFSARLRLLLLIIPAGSQSAMCLLKCVVETCDVWLLVCLWVGHLFLPGRRRKTKGLVRMQPSIMLQINSHVQRTTRTEIIIVIIIPAGVEYVNKGKKQTRRSKNSVVLPLNPIGLIFMTLVESGTRSGL